MLENNIKIDWTHHKLEIREIVRLHDFVRQPFYILTFIFSKIDPEDETPNFTMYFSNDKQKLRKYISGEDTNEDGVHFINFKEDPYGKNDFIPEVKKRLPAYEYCFLAADRPSHVKKVDFFYQFKRP